MERANVKDTASAAPPMSENTKQSLDQVDIQYAFPSAKLRSQIS